MKLNQIVPTLYVDLDGVLSNFDKYVTEILGDHPENIPQEEMWEQISKYIARSEFWSRFDKMPDADILWNYVRKFNPYILTATGITQYNESSQQKREWVKKHLNYSRVITVKESRDKSQYADTNSILIDDSEKSINPWVNNGGIGILHKSAKDTIEQLNKLGL